METKEETENRGRRKRIEGGGVMRDDRGQRTGEYYTGRVNIYLGALFSKNTSLTVFVVLI